MTDTNQESNSLPEEIYDRSEGLSSRTSDDINIPATKEDVEIQDEKRKQHSDIIDIKKDATSQQQPPSEQSKYTDRPRTETLPSGIDSQINRVNSTDITQLQLTNLQQQLQKSKKDLESMVLRYANSERENLQNKKKVDDFDKKLKKAIKDNEQLANRIRLLTNDKNQLTETLNAKVAQLTVLEQKNSHLTNVQGARLKECEEKLILLETTNEELNQQIESYKSKEGELLDFSERLSMKHMLLQNELDEALKKVPNYKNLYEASLKEKEEVLEKNNKLSEQIESLRLELKEERQHSDNLKSDLEKNELKHKYHIDELQNENKVIRRKHQIANKELLKEIKHLNLKLSERRENLEDDVQYLKATSNNEMS